jgi:hypothetical protein
LEATEVLTGHADRVDWVVGTVNNKCMHMQQVRCSDVDIVGSGILYKFCFVNSEAFETDEQLAQGKLE